MTMIKAAQPLVGELQLQHLIERLEGEEKRKSDYVVPLNSVRINREMKFESSKTGEFTLTEKGFKQLCQSVDNYNLPHDYMMKLFEADKEHFAHVMNWHLEHGVERERKLRGIRDAEGNLSIRGIVSPSFTAFDNLDALDVFMKAMKIRGIEDYQIKTSNIKEDYMMLRFVLPSTMKNFGKTVDGRDDLNYMSMDLINGETGNSPLKLLSSIYRLVCTNGMVVRDTVSSLSKRHVGEQRSFSHDMISAVKEGVVVSNKALEELALSKSIAVENPYETIAAYAKQIKMSEQQQKVVRENYDIEGEKNVMAVINAFTRTARDLKDVEKRIQLETFASKIMEKELKRLG